VNTAAATWDSNIADAREQLALAQPGLARAKWLSRHLALKQAADAEPWSDGAWAALERATDGLPELDAEDGAPLRVYAS